MLIYIAIVLTLLLVLALKMAGFAVMVILRTAALGVLMISALTFTGFRLFMPDEFHALERDLTGKPEPLVWSQVQALTPDDRAGYLDTLDERALLALSDSIADEPEQ